MIAWVYRAARACPLLDQVLIATDSDEVLNFAQQHLLPAVFTPEDCASGTDRVWAVAQSIPADIYVNIQGDEPLLTRNTSRRCCSSSNAPRFGVHARRPLPP